MLETDPSTKAPARTPVGTFLLLLLPLSLLPAGAMWARNRSR